MSLYEIDQYLHMHWSIAAGIVILATFVSEDLTSIGVGLAARLELLSLSLAMLAALTGVFLGDILLYGIGRSLRRGLFLSVRKFFLPEQTWSSVDAAARSSSSFNMGARGVKKKVNTRFSF